MVNEMSRTNRDIKRNKCKKNTRNGVRGADCNECKGCSTHTKFLRKDANTRTRAAQNNALRNGVDDPEIPIFKSEKEWWD